MNVEETVIAKIAEALQVDPTTIQSQTTMTDIVAWDSMGKMSILFAITDEFGIELAPNETDKLNSVQSIMTLIQERAQNK